MKLNSRN